MSSLKNVRVAPEATVVPAPSTPRPEADLTMRVPADTVPAPVKVLSPESVSVPSPFFVRPPAPFRGLAMPMAWPSVSITAPLASREISVPLKPDRKSD